MKLFMLRMIISCDMIPLIPVEGKAAVFKACAFNVFLKQSHRFPLSFNFKQ